ncbi:hypothetical protein BJX65DRAFT_306421 [Aspergillus insuetus]
MDNYPSDSAVSEAELADSSPGTRIPDWTPTHTHAKDQGIAQIPLQLVTSRFPPTVLKWNNTHIALSPDDKLLAVTEGKAIHVYSTSTRKPTDIFQYRLPRVQAVIGLQFARGASWCAGFILIIVTDHVAVWELDEDGRSIYPGGHLYADIARPHNDYFGRLTAQLVGGHGWDPKEPALEKPEVTMANAVWDDALQTHTIAKHH